MTILPIIKYPDPRLRMVCAPVSEITDDLRTLANDMLETMYDAPGIGLAAPQVGVLQRLIVMDCVKEEGVVPRPMALFNPVVTWASDEIGCGAETCLSVPGKTVEVCRSNTVDVRWIDLSGEVRDERFNRVLSTCAQHEIDHLNGKLIVDYLKKE